LWRTHRPVTSGGGEPTDPSLLVVENPSICHLLSLGEEQEVTGQGVVPNRK
jgi:hypothetical protein